MSHPNNRGSETSGRGRFAGGVHGARQEGGHVLEQLGLGTGRVPHNGNIDVTT